MSDDDLEGTICEEVWKLAGRSLIGLILRRSKRIDLLLQASEILHPRVALSASLIHFSLSLAADSSPVPLVETPLLVVGIPSFIIA